MRVVQRLRLLRVLPMKARWLLFNVAVGFALAVLLHSVVSAGQF